MSSPASSNPRSPFFFPRSPSASDSVEAGPGLARTSSGDSVSGCDGDSLGSNKGGRCAKLEFTDGQHMCFFCFKMMPSGA